MSADFVMLSLGPMTIGLVASLVCALIGNFLILRSQAMMGDAISHVALPGIVAAFIVTGTVASGPMMLGATLAAIVAVVLIEALRRARIESGAAMGIVFTSLFALGVLGLELSHAAGVHLDVEHALYGNLESLVWFSAEGWRSLLNPAALADLPPQLPRLLLALIGVAGFIALFWKELVLSSFDPAHAAVIGARPSLVGLGLSVAVAIVAVLAFDAVGAIIVIAMLICPPAAARLMTDSLPRQIGWSLAFAAVAALAGYGLAAFAPPMLGAKGSVSAAGMMASMAGAILFAACLAGPRRRALNRA